MECFKILVFLNDNVFIFLVENSHSLLFIAHEEVVNGVNRELHLKDLVPPEVDEIGVVCQAYFQVVALYFIGDLHDEMLEDPLDIVGRQVPF